MKSVTLRVSWAHNTGFDLRSHAYVEGSSTPLCMPPIPGELPRKVEGAGHVALCPRCSRLFVDATVATMPFRERCLWWVKTTDARAFDPETARHIDFAAYLAGARSGIVSNERRGVAADEEQATRDAHAAIEQFVPGVPVKLSEASPSHLASYARELRADERAAKVGTGSDAQLTEYAYEHARDYVTVADMLANRWTWRTIRYRVTKKTAKRYFLEAGVSKTEAGNVLLSCYSVDRAELEAGRHRRFTLNPEAPASPFAWVKPEWAEVLGVEVTCSVRDVKTAFRSKAKECHPDHGGSTEAFQRVKAAFDAAMQARGAA